MTTDEHPPFDLPEPPDLAAAWQPAPARLPLATKRSPRPSMTTPIGARKSGRHRRGNEDRQSVH